MIQIPSALADSAPTSQIVTFRIDGQSFGVDVARVREIRGWQPVTPIPDAASHVLGVLNLRGEVVTIYDLRSQGRGPRGFRVGRELRFRASEIDAWLVRMEQADAARHPQVAQR